MCGPHFCSMKITEDVRRYAAEQGIAEEDALQHGMKTKAEEYVELAGGQNSTAASTGRADTDS